MNSADIRIFLRELYLWAKRRVYNEVFFFTIKKSESILSAPQPRKQHFLINKYRGFCVPHLILSQTDCIIHTRRRPKTCFKPWGWAHSSTNEELPNINFQFQYWTPPDSLKNIRSKFQATDRVFCNAQSILRKSFLRLVMGTANFGCFFFARFVFHPEIWNDERRVNTYNLKAFTSPHFAKCLTRSDAPEQLCVAHL